MLGYSKTRSANMPASAGAGAENEIIASMQKLRLRITEVELKRRTEGLSDRELANLLRMQEDLEELGLRCSAMRDFSKASAPGEKLILKKIWYASMAVWYASMAVLLSGYVPGMSGVGSATGGYFVGVFLGAAIVYLVAGIALLWLNQRPRSSSARK